MSLYIQTDDEKKLRRDLECKQVVNGRPIKTIYPYIFRNARAAVPMSYGISQGYPAPERSTFPAIDRVFTGVLRPEQVEVNAEAVALMLKHKTCTLGVPTGFGKTVTAIHIAIRTKFKTLILVNRLVLVDQWVDAVKKHTNATVASVAPSTEGDCKADFVITNILNLDKYDIDFTKQFGLVIADEIHLLTSPVLCKKFLRIYPRYLLGLSATPYRLDNLSKIITLFFGEHQVTRPLFREHIVRKISSPFTPIIRHTAQGLVDWTDLITQQCMNKERNDQIVELVNTITEGGVLVLCKRRDQVTYLHDKVPESTMLLGGDDTYDPNCRIIFATISKGGVGFDNVNISTLVMATDARDYYLQILGRCFRKLDTIPVVYDIVDNNPMLEAHWAERSQVYRAVGGRFENFCI